MDLLRQPGHLRDGGPPVTRLLTVERDGNPLRRHGHVSPHIGKVAPLDAGALHHIARLAAASLPTSPGPTLVVGMAESALLLAWFLAARLGEDAELRYTTREQRGAPGVRTFIEPHSHGPVHSLDLPAGRVYGRVVIVEDELTSGATLRNLLLAIGDVSTRYHVVTLADLRSPQQKERLREETARLGIHLSVLDLSQVPEQEEEYAPPKCGSPVSPRNPHGRSRAVFARAVGAVTDACRSGAPPGALYAIGECVDVAMAARGALLPGGEPVFRHVTRSPWLVDGGAVRSRLVLRAPPSPRYFLYNWEEGLPRRALVVCEESARPVARRLERFLVSRGVEARTIVVPGA